MRLVAIVDVIQIDAETGAGRQRQDISLLLARTHIVRNGDQIETAVDAAEKRPLGLRGYLVGRQAAVRDEDALVLLLQPSHLIGRQLLPVCGLYGLQRTIIDIDAGRHTHPPVDSRHRIAFLLGHFVGLAGLGSRVVLVG